MPSASAIHRLWDELSDHDASQADVALTHLMTVLSKLGGIANVTWAGAVRMGDAAEGDPLQGWRVGRYRSLGPIGEDTEDRHFGQILDVWERREVDPSFLLPLREVGTFRTYSLRKGLPASWFASPFYRTHYGAVGIYDAVFVAFPLNPDCESHFGFYSGEPIADETVAQLAFALRGLKWFHRQLMLSEGLLVASSPLTPTERRVLQLLLTDASEKTVAFQLGVAPSTAHQHVLSIYRKYGVRSRVALMRLWLN